MQDNVAAKRRLALIGTGFRGTGMWGINVVKGYGEHVEIAGLCDTNWMRADRARSLIGLGNTPIYADADTLLAEVKPDAVMVCTPDANHDEMIVKALEAGCDVITEKPMTTTAAKVRRILDAEARTGRKVAVTFNYRFSPTARRLKELLLSGVIGEVTAMDFHWYLDTKHGADYFRRWHAYEKNSGSLFVHKATHHFDLMNWYLASDPEEVVAHGSLQNYGAAGPFRGARCRGCEHAGKCSYYFDLSRDSFLETLFEEPSREDGYVRDGCVYRSDIDIPDTMSALIRYASGAEVTYSLNTYMPIEGYFIAFNGKLGRIEIRQYERQPWETPSADEILLIRNFGKGVERIMVPHEPGTHFGGDPKMQDMFFKPGIPDPLGQRAGARAGAMSVLCGIAALESAKTKRPVSIASLLRPEAGEAKEKRTGFAAE
jgi:predicted dehydrogenase